MLQNHLQGPRLHDSQPLPSTASHSSSAFQEILRTTPRDKGETGYARAHLEDNGIFKPLAGQKRKHGDDSARSEDHSSAKISTSNHIEGSSQSKRPSPRFTGPNFRYSRYRQRLMAAAEEANGVKPQFKRPESVQKEKLLTSMSQTNDGVHFPESTPSKRRRADHPASSPQTPDASFAGPYTANSTTLSSANSNCGSPFPSTVSNNAKQQSERSLNQTSSMLKRKQFDSTSSAVTFDGDGPSNSSADGEREATKRLKRTHSTGENRKERRSGLATEYINRNGTKISRGNNIHVPTIDQEIQYPPTDLPSLTRLLNQVPTILTDLNNKQTNLIRELAVKVNDQEKEIRVLRSENEKLDKRILQTETNVAEYVSKKFAEMERKFNNKIEGLEEESELLTGHINAMGERITAHVNNKVASMNRIQGASPSPPRREVIDLPDEEESGQEEATDVFTGLMTPKK